MVLTLPTGKQTQYAFGASLSDSYIPASQILRAATKKGMASSSIWASGRLAV